MRIIIDTNIVLDVLLKRSEFFEPSYEVLKLATLGKIEGYVTANSITDIYYVIQKNNKDRSKSKDAIRGLLQLVKISDVLATDIINALEMDMDDYEDAVLSSTAKRTKAQLIVTRNIKDFTDSWVEAVSPQELIAKFS